MEESDPRTATPSPLALVQAFINTADIEEGRDELGDVGGATAWLTANQAAVRPPLTESDRARLVAVREALRDLLEAQSDASGAATAAGELDRLLQGALLRPVFRADGITLQPAAPGADTFLGLVAAAIMVAGVDGSWARLKICRDDTCRWAFYDRSKNAHGSWCSMRVCGSRAKARAYRSRKRSAPPSPGDPVAPSPQA